MRTLSNAIYAIVEQACHGSFELSRKLKPSGTGLSDSERMKVNPLCKNMKLVLLGIYSEQADRQRYYYYDFGQSYWEHTILLGLAGELIQNVE